MDFVRVASILNELLSKRRPTTLNSSWILRHAPACYRFIRKWIRTEVGGIDWDQVTYILDPPFQRRWNPRGRRRPASYANAEEVALILNRYREKLYVFIAPADVYDRRLRDMISIALVRVAQNGNILARQELMKLVGYTIDDWLDDHPFLSRWRGYDEDLRAQVEGCIRRYRYTGSFIHYLHKTLEYAARGMQPPIAYSLDEVLSDRNRRKIDLIAQQPKTVTTTNQGWRCC
jgi:hypothetical protein